MHRFIRAALALALAFTAALPAAQAQTKKLVRIHTAGPADLGVDNTMLAHQFMTYVNANSDTIEVKVFPNSQLGQSREVIEAMRLGSRRVGHHRRPGRVRVVRQARRRARACRSCGRATTTRSRCSTARSARSSRPTWRRPASRCCRGR